MTLPATPPTVATRNPIGELHDDVQAGGFVPTDAQTTGPDQIHFDLTGASYDQHQATVEEATWCWPIPAATSFRVYPD